MSGLVNEFRYLLLDTPPFALALFAFVLGYGLAVFVHRVSD